jgi:uncharacterized protein YceK
MKKPLTKNIVSGLLSGCPVSASLRFAGQSRSPAYAKATADKLSAEAELRHCVPCLDLTVQNKNAG